MSSQPITDYSARALAKLLEQYKNKPNFAALIESIMSPLQNLEDTLVAIRDERALDSSHGVQMDLLGGIVGAVRKLGESDQSFLTDIKIQIAANSSQGTPENLISLFTSLLPGFSCWLIEWFPCAYSILTTTALTSAQVAQIKSALAGAEAAGVRLDSIVYYDATNAFTLDPSTDGGGLGDLNDASVGGMLASIEL